MTVMTTQPPLPLIPTGTTEIGAAAAMIEDEHGGRVFVHGNLSFAWDAGDTAGRRFAAVSLMRIKAATQVQVAAAFDTSPLTVWRWAQALSAAGVSALVPHRKGPRRASKLTPEVIATIAVLREQGLSLRAIGEQVAVSEASVRRALSTPTPTPTPTIPQRFPTPTPTTRPTIRQRFPTRPRPRIPQRFPTPTPTPRPRSTPRPRPRPRPTIPPRSPIPNPNPRPGQGRNPSRWAGPNRWPRRSWDRCRGVWCRCWLIRSIAAASGCGRRSG